MMDPTRPRFSKRILAAWILLGWSLGAGPADTKNPTPDIPKVWDEAALADWVTPLAGLNLRPTHISEKEYYSMPEYILRSYRSICRGANRKDIGTCCSTSARNR